MTTQTDILATTPITATGQFQDATAAGDLGRVRVKAVYIVPAAAAGSLVLRDGGASGAVRATINTVGSVTQPTYLLLPGEGIVFRNDVHGTVTNLGSAMLFYG